MKYYIFDFDGVLGDTFEDIAETRIEMGLNDTIEAARIGVMDYANNKSWHTRGVSEEVVEKARRFMEQFAFFMLQKNPRPFMGFVDELKKIKDAQMAIVSSGPGAAVRKLLRQIDLDFTHILCHEDHHSKEEKVEQVCADWGIDIDDMYYFTDSKADVWELSDIMDKSKIIGCAWGFSGYDKLRELLPAEQIMKDFADIHKIG